MQLTNAFESDQETAEFVFPPENALNGIEAFAVNLRIEDRFAPALRRFASRNSGDSFRLPAADTNGAITLQFRSQKATTLSPLKCL